MLFLSKLMRRIKSRFLELTLHDSLEAKFTANREFPKWDPKNQGLSISLA